LLFFGEACVLNMLGKVYSGIMNNIKSSKHNGLHVYLNNKRITLMDVEHDNNKELV